MSGKIKLGLAVKLLLSIALGILIGHFAPIWISKTLVTLSSLFVTFLRFIIPMLIIAFVTVGIANLSQGASKLLGITGGISYTSSILCGAIAFAVAFSIFPSFISPDIIASIGDPEEGMLSPFFTIPVKPIIDVTSAVLLAFVMGLSLSILKAGEEKWVIHKAFNEFSDIISKVLKSVIIPLLPLYICGTFVNMTVGGHTFTILNILWKVFLIVISLHLLYLLFLFCISGIISRKNPFWLMKNQIPGYLTAIGTQSSAATIPINLKCAEADGVSLEIRNFVIPLCANIHMAGSMITITSCVTAALLMFNMPISLSIIIPFIMMLGIAMIASPGAPGGSIMTALAFLPMVGIAPESAVASLLIALYITQDSFGTACNVSGDNAISVIIDTIYRKHIKQ
jgi:Na+/H+-dicarboxylate symporter